MKKIFIVLLTILLIFSASACGDPDKPDEPNSGNGEGGAVIENKVELSLDKEKYDKEERIEVTLDFKKLKQENAVIVIVATDTEHKDETAVHDNYEEYRYLSDFSELPFYLWAPAEDGVFDVRVYADSDGGEELASITIAVGSAKLPQSDKNDSSNGEDNSGGTTAGGDNGEDPRDVTQKEMEAQIVAYLSKICDVKALTLCGGKRIEYDLADWLMTVDAWIIEKPEISYNELKDSMNSQLTAAGMTYTQNELGSHVWTVKSGDENIGIELFVFLEGDDSFMIRTTHSPEDYK